MNAHTRTSIISRAASHSTGETTSRVTLLAEPWGDDPAPTVRHHRPVDPIDRRRAMMVEMAKLDAILRKSKPTRDPCEAEVAKIAQDMIRQNWGLPIEAPGIRRGSWVKPQDGEHGARNGRKASIESDENTRAALAFMRSVGRAVSSAELAKAGIYKATERGSTAMNWLFQKGIVCKKPITKGYKARHPEAINCKCLWEPAE